MSRLLRIPHTARVAITAALLLGTRMAAGQIQLGEDTIDYARAPHSDRVGRLQEQLAAKTTSLVHETKHGYLPALLRALDISPTSQTLVFAKTSFQRNQISPRQPRALYFNDDTYVGWVQGGEVYELAAIDPRLGGIFYTMAQQQSERPAVGRLNDDCLQCHASSMTDGVPGFMVRSIYPAPSGNPILSAGSFRTSFRSPLAQRWGGWYVSGTHGKQRHMGNALLHGEDPEKLDRERGANLASLADRFDTAPYLTPHSDIVALMVLEHQVVTHNAIAVAHYQARLARRDQEVLNKMDGKPADAPIASVERRYQWTGDAVLKCLLFEDEARLTDPVRGTAGFAEDFAGRGPKDQRGRSLREFDLKTRLFKYPCSYLIYSAAFQALPEPVKAHIYRRLFEVVTNRAPAGLFKHLSADDRRAIYEILGDTLPDLPAYWKS